ncbi:hypothetical protein K2173_013708 [Erythroxylum novogranatense]|uniref:Uncharacterized protein n=1 Tax=Erythroxylum novogranatense TaxID=1862640 RepID=A0AAV8SAP9_9ROSI|nr:hypothetical protein K2173_013708 [Erythroxylum novogranatense]
MKMSSSQGHCVINSRQANEMITCPFSSKVLWISDDGVPDLGGINEESTCFADEIHHLAVNALLKSNQVNDMEGGSLLGFEDIGSDAVTSGNAYADAMLQVEGKWKAPMIDNPDFKDDPDLYVFPNLKYVGIELWQVKSGTFLLKKLGERIRMLRRQHLRRQKRRKRRRNQRMNLLILMVRMMMMLMLKGMTTRKPNPKTAVNYMMSCRKDVNPLQRVLG